MPQLRAAGSQPIQGSNDDRPGQGSGVQQARIESAHACGGRPKMVVRRGDRAHGATLWEKILDAGCHRKVSGGFLIPLPYGTDVDWLRNVQAAGRAAIRVHGQSFIVAEPVVIDAATAAGLLSPRRQREFGRFGIANYLKMSQA